MWKLITVLLISVSVVKATLFEASYSFKCPLEIDFECNLSLWEKDQWPVKYGTLLDKVSRNVNGGDNITGILKGSHDSQKIKGKQFDIDVEITHSCTKDGSKTCERWHFGYCNKNSTICKFEKEWTLNTEPHKGSLLLKMNSCAGDGN